MVDGVIKGVRTPHGTVETGTVICAAGAWSRTCGEMAGVQLDVTPLRRQVLFTAPMADLPGKLPLTIDFATGFYFHREGRGLLTGMADPNETPGFSIETTDDWIPGLLAVAERRAPRIASAPIQGGWAGLYDMSPDHNAMIGEAKSVSRFLYATGFSGHGFLQGPATGEILRDLVLGRDAVHRRHADERRALRRRDARARVPCRLTRPRGPAPSNVDLALEASATRSSRAGSARANASRRSRWRRSWGSRAHPCATRSGCSSATGWSSSSRTAARSSPSCARSTCSRSTRCAPRSARSRCTS